MTGTEDDMRAALRRLAKAVVIITSWHDGVRYAMAATAVSELSLAPPSLLICVNQSASLHAPLSEGAPFGINILEQDQEHLARLCSGAVKGEARFAQGEWEQAANGVPILAKAQASFACINRQTLIFGTHALFIGEVEEVVVHGDPDPLIYCDQRYGAFRVNTRQIM